MTAADRLDAIEARANAATEGPWEVGDRYHIQGASHCACRPSHGPLVWEGRRGINGQVMQTHIHRRPLPLDDDETTVYGGALPEPVVIALSTDEYVHISAEDAEFIAHARQDVPALVAAVRAVLDLHWPVDWQRANPETGELDEPSPENALNPFCRECTDDEYVSAVEYGDTIDLGSPVVYYPCPTVRAITTALEDQA